MKNKRVNTKIWVDSWFASLSKDSSRLFLYFITCSHMGFTGFAEIPERVVMFEARLTKEELDKCKDELKPKVKFYKDWVFVVNLLKHDPIKGEKNKLLKPYKLEKESIPPKVYGALMGHGRGIDGGKERKGKVRKGKETVGKGPGIINKKRKELKI